MSSSAKFCLHQRVRVIAQGKWHRRIGTVCDLTDYGSISVMFNPWVAPRNRRGRLIPVIFNESELEIK